MTQKQTFLVEEVEINYVLVTFEHTGSEDLHCYLKQLRGEPLSPQSKNTAAPRDKLLYLFCPDFCDVDCTCLTVNL